MRIVVKTGTRSLLTPDRLLDREMIAALAAQIASLRTEGHQIVLVSSGAVGAGRGLWRSKDRIGKIGDPVLEKQMLAAIGQASLIDAYNHALAGHGMVAAQLLLTRHDFRHRRHAVNIGHLLERLIREKDILPVVNENDSVAVDELMFTDNDELAGLLAQQVNADRLIILTDVDGVYDLSGEQPQVIAEIDFEKNESTIETGKMTGGGRGGMASKLETARRMARAGITTHIARARTPDILLRLLHNDTVGTRTLPSAKPTAVKRWLVAGQPPARGGIRVNDCLAAKLRAHRQALSILPVGITEAIPPFEKGDVVEIRAPDGTRIGCGVARYGAEELAPLCGVHQKPVFIHYNSLHIE